MATILIVDDEAANRELLRFLLAHDGHDVLAAESGEEGLELLSARKPELAIVDLYMPGLSGTEFIKRVRRSDDEMRETRIALYTGTRADDAMRDFMQLMKIAHIIPKPGEPEEIIAAVRAALL